VGRGIVSLDGHNGTPQVAVRAVWLQADPAVRSSLRGLLSPDEIDRADRFAFERLRVSYEVSHGALRVLLAQYVGCDPGDLAFTFGTWGKPALRGESRVRFNMSHSGELAVYAIALDCEVGVDVEKVREISDLEEIAERFFSRAEVSELLSIGDAKQRRAAFFRCWTRKESYIKSVGDGLSSGLDQFQVTLLPGAPAGLVHIGNDAGAGSAWTLQHLEPAPGYVGALAYRGSARKLELSPPLSSRDVLELSPTTASRLPGRDTE